jgi:hypothetical protein
MKLKMTSFMHFIYDNSIFLQTLSLQNAQSTP